MKEITIRECAIRACGAIEYGDGLLLAICKEAVTGQPVDWSAFPDYYHDRLRPIYEAIAPDIIDSVASETSYQEFMAKLNEEAE